MHTTSIPRSILLALAFLATGAAADPDAPSPAQRTLLPSESSGDSSAYLSGRFAASQLEFGRAGDYFLQALAAAPLDQELVTQAFLACLDGGRPEAIELAKRLPGNQTAQLLLAGVEAKAGNWAAAERRFQAIPPEGLNQVLQPLLLAWSQQGAGQTDLALATLAPYVQGQHLQSVYALHAALIADLAGRNTEAAQFYQLAQAEPGTLNLRSAEMLASWEMRQGRADEALEIFRKLAATADEMAIALPDLSAAASLPVISQATDGIAETYLALAAALRQQDASDSALLLIRLALNLKPNFTAARLLLAEIMEASKRPDAALATLAAVDPSDPLISIVRLRRAALTEALGKTDDAIRMLEQIAKDYPSSPLPYAQEGDLLRAKNRYGQAVTAYDRAIDRVSVPTRATWVLFYARGVAYERSHQWSEAEADLKRALELSPDQPYVLNYLGYSWADQGINLDQARQMIQRAAELRPNDGAITDSMGWVELREGHTEAAVSALERAAELMPEDPTINGHLGDAYWQAGRKREAEFQWRRALALNPEPEDAAKLEAKLHQSPSPDAMVPVKADGVMAQ